MTDLKIKTTLYGDRILTIKDKVRIPNSSSNSSNVDAYLCTDTLNNNKVYIVLPEQILKDNKLKQK